jgi:RimJ/RimL family protein N-acetyltransferase
MLSQLPLPDNPDIDKFAILLRPVEENAKPWTNKQGKPKMIGMTGTNRWSHQGMETGYFMNVDYWGKGYASEAFAGFLQLFWSLEDRKWIQQLVAKVDSGNVASHKIVLRSGAREGEVLKDWYSRAIDNGVKRDIGCWYYDRPDAGKDELESWREEIEKQMKRKKESEEAKAEREMLKTEAD